MDDIDALRRSLPKVPGYTRKFGDMRCLPNATEQPVLALLSMTRDSARNALYSTIDYMWKTTQKFTNLIASQIPAGKDANALWLSRYNSRTSRPLQYMYLYMFVVQRDSDIPELSTTQ